MKSIIFLLLFVVISCTESYLSPNQLPFNKIKVDGEVKFSPEIKKLRKEFETQSFLEVFEKQKKIKSTNVISESILTGEKKTVFFDRYRCFAQIYQKKLNIFISYNNGLGGGGLKIIRNKDLFSIRPSSWDDIGGSENDSRYHITYQYLTLDKLDYKVGDSIFGKVNVEILQFFPEVKYEYDGKKFYEKERVLKKKFTGYFQTIIKEEIAQ